MPEHTYNVHLHIIDPFFPNKGQTESQIDTFESYHTLDDRLNLPRTVFVQTELSTLDNMCLLDAISRFGTENAREIAVVNASVPGLELEALHSSGVQGLRFSI